MKHLVAFVLLIATASVAHAKVVLKEIDYKAGDVHMQGFLAYDDELPGKLPGVLVIHEWWGNNDYAKFRAQELAKLGYVAFAADMFGKGKTTNDPKQAGEWATAVKGNPQLARDRALAGLDILKQQPNVIPDKVAAIGYCFGGTVALHMARGNLPIKGVVSFHGDLSTTVTATKIEPKILALTGLADPMVPADQVDTFKAEMAAAGADAQVIGYPGAQHSFTNPNADAHNIPGVKYDAAANKKSWEDMQAFFKRIFG